MLRSERAAYSAAGTDSSSNGDSNASTCGHHTEGVAALLPARLHAQFAELLAAKRELLQVQRAAAEREMGIDLERVGEESV